MGFKDQLAKDVAGVFINPGEFADQHTVNGDLAECVVDDDIIQERTGLEPSMNYDGVNVVKKMLYIAESFFEHIPIVDERFTLDDEYYSVKHVSNNMGMLEIELERNST